MANASTLPEFLKPFHDRAALAEERLAKLEAALKATTGKSEVNDSGELLSSLLELRDKLEKSRQEHKSEKEQWQKEQETLLNENAKLQYRIIHLVRALKETDDRLENAAGGQ
ncbi:hypothetical protein KP509_11G009400 [Ceratopteris richardii]|uniref:Uncharacterized protein n=1 Tax=Ceratopteris richardii TaxID=49495 RepID=A0A8T2TQ32_CERRI|nr:hypothetical protein KP509_11G009400 [Ceratopteris richardii]